MSNNAAQSPITSHDNKTAGFMTHYNTLKQTAETLKTMTEPDVDKIMPLVNQGMESYKEVMARIESVRQSLDQISD